MSPLRSQVAVRSSGGRASPPIGASACRLLVALATGYLAVTGCDYSGYPLEATFCDDWCRVLRRTGCEQEPENCIRDCEGSLPSERCLALQSSLLDCYESMPADRFECVGQGFQSTVRPRPEICTEQRQALIRCEVPRVMECVDACAALAPSAPSMGGVVDAGAAPSLECPQPPFPCERLCWELDARFGRGRPITQQAVDVTDDTDLAAIGAPLIRCAQERAAECRAGVSVMSASAAPVGASAPGPTASDVLGPSWTAFFLECADLPVDFGLFD